MTSFARVLSSPPSRHGTDSARSPAARVNKDDPRMRGSAEAGSRALVVCDQWLGSDGYAGMKALRRAGWDVHVVPEWEFVPARYRSFHMKAIGKVFRPLAVREYNREVQLQARRLEPDMLLVFKGTWVQ